MSGCACVWTTRGLTSDQPKGITAFIWLWATVDEPSIADSAGGLPELPGSVSLITDTNTFCVLLPFGFQISLFYITLTCSWTRRALGAPLVSSHAAASFIVGSFGLLRTGDNTLSSVREPEWAVWRFYAWSVRVMSVDSVVGPLFPRGLSPPP